MTQGKRPTGENQFYLPRVSFALVALATWFSPLASGAAVSPAAPFGVRFDRLQTTPQAGISIGLKKIETIDGIPNDGFRFDILAADGQSLLKRQAPYEDVIRGYVGARVFEDRVFLFSRNQVIVLNKGPEGYFVDKRISLKTAVTDAVAKGAVSANQRFVAYLLPMPVTEANPSQRLRVSAIDWSTGELVESKILLGSVAAVEHVRVTNEGHIQVLSRL